MLHNHEIVEGVHCPDDCPVPIMMEQVRADEAINGPSVVPDVIIVSQKPLNMLAEEIHATAVDKGWWDEERTAAEVLINIHGEVSEAWEDWRVGREAMTFAINADQYPVDAPHEAGMAFRTFVNYAQAMQAGREVAELPEGVMDVLIRAGIAEPVGMEVEVADIIIRCLDMLGARGTDIDKVVRTKMNYNKTRAHRHGGKRA